MRVFSNGGILLIEVGEEVCEPAFGYVFLVAPGGVGIGEGAEVALGDGVMGRSAVEPGWFW